MNGRSFGRGSLVTCTEGGKPFIVQSLLSHLTNSDGCGNLQPKVLLTVSPFRPSFSPQPGVFSQAVNSCSQSRSSIAEKLLTTHCSLSTLCPLSPLSTAFTPNRSLTPLSTAFTQTHRGGGPSVCRIRSKITIRKPKFDALLSTFRMNTCKSVSKQRTLTAFRMNTYEKRGGGGPLRNRPYRSPIR